MTVDSSTVLVMFRSLSAVAMKTVSRLEGFSKGSSVRKHSVAAAKLLQQHTDRCSAA